MNIIDDERLLREYSATGSEAAFAALVRRYMNVVWSAARRQVSDASVADEITSAVFLVLAQKARSLREDTILTGWLLRTTRLVAANAVRREARRQQREQEIMNTLLLRSESDAAWMHIAPLLDEALVRLGERDRDAVALRFFDERSFHDIGQVLGITEDNAQKRVSRALEKLRGHLERHGVKVPAATLAAALAANCVQGAPASLVVTVAAAGSGVLAGSSSLPALAQATVEALAWARFKVVAGLGLVVLGTLATVLGLTARKAGWSLATSSAAPIAAASAGTIPALARTKASAPSPAAPPTAEQFRFQVLDGSSGSPIPNAALTLVQVTDNAQRRTNQFTTDRNGMAFLPRPQVEVTNWNYRIEVQRDGYVPVLVSWSFAQGDRFAEFPREHATWLERGTEIGGLVLGELNEPVVGAQVVFSVSGTSPFDAKERERRTWMGSYHREVTDLQGHWHCDHVPTNFGVISYELVHPEYQATNYYVTAPENPRTRTPSVTKAALIEQSAVMTVKPGFTVAGQVVDEAGKPLANAKVTQNHFFVKPGSSVFTDAQGHFSFRNARVGTLNLTIAAVGHAPTNHLFQVQPATNEFRYVLPVGRELRGRVLDEDSQPVDQARITTGPSPRNTQTIEWTGHSDATGRFEWLAAPAYQESYLITAPGFMMETNLQLHADGTEQLITLRKRAAEKHQYLRLAGQVTDGDTSQPLERFEVLVARPRVYGGSRSKAKGLPEFDDLDLAASGHEGRYQWLMDRPPSRFVTEVRSAGYLPVRTTNACGPDASIALNFMLHRATPIQGIVRSPTGHPIRGATVVLVTGRPFLPLESGGRLNLNSFKPQNGVFTNTAADGSYRLNPQLDAQWLVAVHASGIAELRMGAAGTNYSLDLKSWGRIEGQLKLGARDTTGLYVRLHSPQWAVNPDHAVSPYFRVTTQAEGRFRFEFVPPGEHSVSFEPDLPVGLALPAYSHTARITVSPGAAAQVQLGGAGRAVTGRVTVEGLGRVVNWRQDVHRLTSIHEYPKELNTYPRRADFDSLAAWTAAINRHNELRREYDSSPAGRATRLNRREYVLLFEPDGSFRVDDVLPGTYNLYIGVRETSVSPIRASSPVLGRAVSTVMVPELESGNGSAPVDLGVVPLKSSEKTNLVPSER